jgi:hypothetical protein
MIEEFKNMQSDCIIKFSNESVIDFLEEEELTVTGVKVYSSDDDTEMVIIEMDDFYLVAHNFESEEKCFIYQLVDEGTTNELEDEGYRFLNDDDDFRHKIVIREDGKSFTYHPSDTGAIYGLTREREDNESDEPQEVAICEFVSNTARLDHILIEREDDLAFIMQGLEINEEDFTLPE